MLGYCYIRSLDEGATPILLRTPLEQYLVREESRSVLHIPFHVQRYTENVEFIIEASAGSIFRIYPYRFCYDLDKYRETVADADQTVQ